MDYIIRPYKGKVVVREIETPNDSTVDLVEYEKRGDSPLCGIVVFSRNGEPAIGATVLFPDFAASPIKLNGEELLILRLDDIIGEINKEENGE